MKLLVVVETLKGNCIASSIANTLTAPEPMPKSPERVPAPNIKPNPSGIRRAVYDVLIPSAGYEPFRRKVLAKLSGGRLVLRSFRERDDVTADPNNISPKIMAIAFVGVPAARNAPKIAPMVVAISRNMPMRILQNPSRT